jgi:uncharacterized protein YndB with AHSA1/START domain
MSRKRPQPRLPFKRTKEIIMKTRDTGPKLTSDEALHGATGRSYEDWFRLLDESDMAARKHGEIAAALTDEHGVDHWWAQTITVAYERARGLRPPHGGRDGLFSVSASKTVRVAVERLFDTFMDEELRTRWLPDGELRQRTAQPGRSARFDWADGATRVNVGFEPKGDARSQVAVAHERLADAQAAEEMKLYWRERLNALKALLEG